MGIYQEAFNAMSPLRGPSVARQLGVECGIDNVFAH